RFRNTDRTAAGADDARPQLARHVLVHVEHADLLRSAGPLVTAAGVEVGLDVAEIDVEQAERLRAVEMEQRAVLVDDAADLLGWKEIAVRIRHVGDLDD